MSIISQVFIKCDTQEVDTIYRAFVAVGTMINSDKSIIPLVKDLGYSKLVINPYFLNDIKIQEVAKQLSQLFISV